MRDLFNTDAGWRYFRNTWITAMLGAAALAYGCAQAVPALAAPPPTATPPAAAAAAPARQIIVFLVWTSAEGDIGSVEVIGQSRTPGGCGSVTLEGAAEHSAQFAENMKKNLFPHLVCGVTISDAQFYGQDESATPTAAPGQFTTHG